MSWFRITLKITLWTKVERKSQRADEEEAGVSTSIATS